MNLAGDNTAREGQRPDHARRGPPPFAKECEAKKGDHVAFTACIKEQMDKKGMRPPMAPGAMPAESKTNN